MAYCSNCGENNPEGARFCCVCGAKMMGGTEDDRQSPPRWERITLHREDTSRREGTTPPRKARNKPAKKKGCGKSVLIIVVVMVLLICGIASLMDGSFGGGTDDDKDKQNVTTFERVMSQASVDSLVGAQGFPKTTDDVAPLGGDYEVVAQGYVVTVSLEPAQNGKVVGKAEMKLAGRSKVKGVYAYCGNSIYGIYENEENVGGKARNYFYAQPDRKSIMMIDGGEYILERKEVKPVEKASEGLLSKDYERSFDDARFEKLRERHKFPLSTVDVSLQSGAYETIMEKQGMKVTVILEIEPVNSDNRQIIGRATMVGKVEGQEERSQPLIITYAGYSTYAMYEKEDEIGSLDAMVLFASSDGKKLEVYDHGEILFTFKQK